MEVKEWANCVAGKGREYVRARERKEGEEALIKGGIAMAIIGGIARLLGR